MTKAVEVITSVQRRRRWSRAEKERIVAAALELDANVSEIARAARIHTSQLFRWRQQLCEGAQVPATFTPVTIAAEPAPSSSIPIRAGAGRFDCSKESTGGCRSTPGDRKRPADRGAAGGLPMLWRFSLRKIGEDVTETLELR
jgi:transposase